MKAGLLGNMLDLHRISFVNNLSLVPDFCSFWSLLENGYHIIELIDHVACLALLFPSSEHGGPPRNEAGFGDGAGFGN